MNSKSWDGPAPISAGGICSELVLPFSLSIFVTSRGFVFFFFFSSKPPSVSFKGVVHPQGRRREKKSSKITGKKREKWESGIPKPQLFNTKDGAKSISSHFTEAFGHAGYLGQEKYHVF